MKFNHQTIILETEEGTAHNEDELKKAWEIRLRECSATHYKIKSVEIVKKED